jgi:hypothetical protein
MTDNRDWQRLGAAVKARRTGLRLSLYGVRIAGGPSQATLGKIEKGLPTEITAETRNRLERALRWPPNTVDLILNGGLPPELDESPRVEVLHEGNGERILIDIVAGVGELSDGDRREILALIRAKQARDT